MQRLVDERGQGLRLGEKLGEGGEGAVYRLATNSAVAVKVYKAALTPDRVAKIRALAAMTRSDVERFTAWPAGLVLNELDQPIGLLLPVVERARDIHHLYNPGSRRKHFPEADWRFLIHVSTNLARAFAAVHQLGLVIGDVNHGSVLVARDGTLRLIDVDSFQVPAPNGQPLLCTVAVPLFQPPELVGADLRSVVRTPQHDAFGLAVLIFHLLLQGRHPYAGRYLGHGDMPIERAIREHRFAFSRNAVSRQMQPPPNTVGLEILPSSIATLFEAAFSPDAGRRGRPLPRHWLANLQTLASDLAKCPRAATHHYPRTLSLCPWCQFEQRTGVFVFGVPISFSSGTSTDDAEYKKLLAFIATVPVPVPPPAAASKGTVSPSPRAQAAPGTTVPSIFAWGVGPLTSLAGLVLLPVGLILVAVGLLLIVVGASTTHGRRRPWVTAYREAKREHDKAVEQAKLANTFPNYTTARQQIAALKASWEGLPGERTRMFQELERNKQKEQLQVHLKAHLIEYARIAAVGPGRIAMLSAYGIDTAADVTYSRVSSVPQFGEVLTGRLVAWRQGVERQFVFDPSKPLPREAVARVEKEIEDRRRRYVDELRHAARALRDASAGDIRAAHAAAQLYNATSARLRQAEADAIAALGKLPA